MPLKVGRSRAAVANALRLLDLHPQVQIWLAQNLVSVGHAKVLLALKAPEEQLLAAETVLRRNATVRSTERMVARLLGIGRGRRKSRRAAGDSSATATAVEDLQNRLQQHLATHVTIHHGEKRGRIEIEYYGTDDLQRIITALGLRDRVTRAELRACGGRQSSGSRRFRKPTVESNEMHVGQMTRASESIDQTPCNLRRFCFSCHFFRLAHRAPQRRRSGRSSRERKLWLMFNGLLIWGRTRPVRTQSRKPEITSRSNCGIRAGR